MATSAFKSTTKRASIGGSSSEDSSNASRSLRRSRSLSRFSRPTGEEPDYIRNAPRGKFVNTVRGSDAAFPEISLDDLALEFFSSSSMNENESDGGVVKRKGREGRPVSRPAEVGRWASDTASSRRRGRSVSRARGDAASSSSTTGAKHVVSSDGAARRRRSLSVARYPVISDSESEVDHSRKSANCASLKSSARGSGQMPLAPKATASRDRQLGRSRSQKDLSCLLDGYSSHSSALTDDESKDTSFGRNGFEKIIRAVYSQNKVDHPVVDAANNGLYKVMRKEIRHAVQEIRTELNEAIGRNRTPATSLDSLQSDYPDPLYSGLNTNCAIKLEQGPQQGHDTTKRANDLSKLRNATTAKGTRTRKRSNDRNRISNKLDDEAEKYIEEFISNLEDAEISSFDGERSDTSSTLGGIMKSRDATSIREVEPYKSPAGSASRPVEMDGIILPWLQWETSQDDSPLGKSKTQTPVTPKSLEWHTDKDLVSVHDPSSYSTSSHGSWSPGLFSSPMDKRESAGRYRASGNDCKTCIDMDELLNLRNKEEALFEMYVERNRISSGGLLLCIGLL